MLRKGAKWKRGWKEDSAEAPGKEPGRGSGMGPQWSEGTLSQQLQEAVGVAMCTVVWDACSDPARALELWDTASTAQRPNGGWVGYSQGELTLGARTCRCVGHLNGTMLPTHSPVKQAGAGAAHGVCAGKMPREIWRVATKMTTPAVPAAVHSECSLLLRTVLGCSGFLTCHVLSFSRFLVNVTEI